jgi:hypothetical protein
VRRITKDGREILTGADWRKQRDLVRLCAHDHCNRCTRYTPDYMGDAHHRMKRGMGGGFRDDRLSNLEWLCRDCHREEEASGNRTKMSRQRSANE